MYKDIVFLDGIAEDYLQDITKFVREWESYSPIISVITSGSTGTPKTIDFTKKQVEASAKYTGQFFNFKKGETLLLNLSPNYIAGKLMLVRAMVYGMKILVAPLKSNPLENLNFGEPIKLGAFVPSQVQEILNHAKAKKNYLQIENVLIGGASIPNQLEQEIEKLSNKNFASFGMTETLTHFALRKITNQNDIYTCLPGIQINQDDRGCLVVEPNNVVQQQLITNDSIEFIDTKNFKWKGRLDNVINSGGVKIFPESDEKLIEHLFKNQWYYLSSKKNERWGEELVLVVEDEQWSIENQEKILHQIEKILPKYHAPKSIIFIDKFDETGNGKIKRKKF